MKKSGFSEERIIRTLRQAGGESTGKNRVCEAQHHCCDVLQLEAEYGGMDVEEARGLRALEDENGSLKSLVADRSAQNQILKEENAKKW